MEFVLLRMYHRVTLSPVIPFFFYSLFSSPLGVTVVSVSNKQAINYIGSWLYDHTTSVIPVVPMSQAHSARSDLPADGQEDLGGVSYSERMMAAMMNILANLKR